MSAPGADPSAAGAIVVMPALNESRRIAVTVRSALAISTVVGVVVADDGSSDDTAAVATAAGATVVSHDRRRGKAAAMMTGAAAARTAGFVSNPLLFLDADLEASAANAAALVTPV